MRRGLQLGDRTLAKRRVECSDHGAPEGAVGANQQILVALGLPIGEALGIRDRGRIAGDRGETDLDTDARLGFALPRGRVEQLDTAAKLRVVDGCAGALIGVEQRADQRRVSVEDGAGLSRVRGRCDPRRVILGLLTKLHQAPGRLGQRRAIVARRVAAHRAEQQPEPRERGVGGHRDRARELRVLRGHEVLRTDGAQGLVVALVLERVQRARRAGGRRRQPGLEPYPIRAVVRVAHLERGEARQRRERHRQGRRQLGPDRQLASHQRSLAPRPVLVHPMPRTAH